MRFPLVRSSDDDTPITAWEIVSAPIALPLLLLGFAAVLILSIPVTLLYPERKVRSTVDEGSAEGRELVAELTRRESQTPFWRRLARAPLLLVVIVVAVPMLTIYDALLGPWRRKD